METCETARKQMCKAWRGLKCHEGLEGDGSRRRQCAEGLGFVCLVEEEQAANTQPSGVRGLHQGDGAGKGQGA